MRSSRERQVLLHVTMLSYTIDAIPGPDWTMSTTIYTKKKKKLARETQAHPLPSTPSICARTSFPLPLQLSNPIPDRANPQTLTGSRLTSLSRQKAAILSHREETRPLRKPLACPVCGALNTRSSLDCYENNTVAVMAMQGNYQYFHVACARGRVQSTSTRDDGGASRVDL